MGVRLLTLGALVTNAGDSQEMDSPYQLTAPETEALRHIRKKFTNTGSFPSARELSRTLGYQSSRSGHRLINQLIAKGILARARGKELRWGRRAVSECFELNRELSTHQSHPQEYGKNDLALNLWPGGCKQVLGSNLFFPGVGQRD